MLYNRLAGYALGGVVFKLTPCDILSARKIPEGFHPRDVLYKGGGCCAWGVCYGRRGFNNSHAPYATFLRLKYSSPRANVFGVEPIRALGMGSDVAEIGNLCYLKTK